jgi:hypothetical protein
MRKTCVPCSPSFSCSRSAYYTENTEREKEREREREIDRGIEREIERGIERERWLDIAS